ncbi:ATP-binding protein [Halobaculum sp. MBLA0143]|uniref:ATP-binding protein n=1 Tax=Halobaculum sp. MBLA0143 TaxID=3079933 RepID=UPI003526ACB9
MADAVVSRAPGFVSRTAELSRLRELYRSNSAELAVVYGRRRLGKTELVSQSLDGRADAVVYQARQKTRALQIEQFLDRAAESYPGVSRLRPDWEPILTYLGQNDAVVVLDEFPYLVAEDESLPSVVQALFDREFDDAAPTFVLVGSSISTMEEAALLGSSPLYGRSSLKLDVRELPFGAATEFLDDPTPTEAVFLWGVFGGVPYYLERLDPTASLAANVHDTVLSVHGTLHDEPDYVLRMELKEPTRYFSILEAIAGGNTGRNEVAGATGIEYNSLSTYLSRLERLRLIERTVPVTERPERSKRGRYRLRDSFFRFWFRFVYGAGGRNDELGHEAFETLIRPELPDFVAPAFERLCRGALRPLYPDLTVTETGRWWYGEHEIDAVGLTAGDTLVVGECKFQSSPAGFDALESLRSHTAELRWSPPDGGDRHVQYALFSRSGFTESLTTLADERDDVRLFDIGDVVAAHAGTDPGPTA